MIAACLLVATALAAEPAGVTLETVAQVRHDYWGETLVPAWQYLAVEQEARSWSVSGLARLDVGAGLGQPMDGDLYVLGVATRRPWGRISLGRLVGVSALRPQTLDGAMVRWDARPGLGLEAWAGYARHQDLDDLRDGAALARVAALAHRNGLFARLGAEAEAGPGVPALARQDLEARFTAPASRLHPYVAGRAVVAEAMDGSGEPVRLEWGRAEAGLHLVPQVSTVVHVQHREVVDAESLLGDALLQTIAGGVVDEVGISSRVFSRRWAALAASWSLSTWDEAGLAAHSGRPALARFAPLCLYSAAVTLLLGLSTIAMDLGHMNRSTEVILHANLRSIMAWMIFLYSTDFALVLLENGLALGPALQRRALALVEARGGVSMLGRLLSRMPLLSEDLTHRWLHRLGFVEIPLAVMFFGGVGALFGTISAREYWHHPLLPILFVAGAILSACGAAAIVLWWASPQRDASWREAMRSLGDLLLVLMLLVVLLEWAQISVPMWQGLTQDAQTLRVLLFGPFWWNYWLVHVALGTVLPLVLLVKWRHVPWVVATAGVLAAGAFFSARLGHVIPPQTQPLLHGQLEAFISPRNSLFYFPNLFEWAVLAGVMALGWALFWLGLRFLPLVPRLDAGTDPAES